MSPGGQSDRSFRERGAALRGIGIDIVDVSRFRRVLARHDRRFAQRWFDEEELSQEGDRVLVLARSFAVKEAVWKALRVRQAGGPVWREIVATFDLKGAVTVRLQGAVCGEAERLGPYAIHASVAVHDSVVLAMAMVECDDRRNPPR